KKAAARRTELSAPDREATIIMVPHCTPVGNVDYRWRNFCRTLPVCFWKVKSDPPADHLVTFAGHLQETLPVQDRDLPLTGCNQTGFFELSHGIGNRRRCTPNISASRVCVIRRRLSSVRSSIM